jgi:hypothetical protein
LNNTITSDIQDSSKTGIQVYYSDWVVINNNNISGKFSEALIDITNSNCEIKNNQLLESTATSKGIYTHGGSSINLVNNIIIAQGKYGIYIASNTPEPISQNSISGWEVGILIENVSANFNNNTIQNSRSYGIYPTEKASVNIVDNIIADNKIGLYAEGMAVLTGNTIRYSSDSGIYVTDIGKVFLENNSITNNEKGVFLIGGDLVSQNNLFSKNTIGLAIEDTTDVIFSNDVFLNNKVGCEARGSEFILANYQFKDNNVSIDLINSECWIYNSTIYSLLDFILGANSHCWVINSDLPKNIINIQDSFSQLEKQWFLNLTILGTSNQTIPNMNVQILDNQGRMVYQTKTSSDGALKWLNVTSIGWNSKGIFDPNSYDVILSKPGYGTILRKLEFTGPLDATFTALRLSELITYVNAVDTPKDQGGSITINWSSIPILNFGNYNIYISKEYISPFIISSLESINTSITDQTQNTAIITEIDGIPLQNGEPYYIAITVSDDLGKEDWTQVTVSNPVIPVDNLSPPPIKNLTGIDTPDDNGKSITLSWEFYSNIDFDYFAIYWFTDYDSTEIDFPNMTAGLVLREMIINKTIVPVSENNVSYYFAVLVFDINGNVDYSVEVFGPVKALDNLPPVLNRALSIPNNFDSLLYNNTETEDFRDFLDTKDLAYFYWYLDGELIENATDSRNFIIMSELSLGNHTLKVIAQEESGLKDTLQWNFSVLEIPEEPSDVTSVPVMFWLAIIILIIILVIFSTFGIRHTVMYTTARRTVKQLPTMGDGPAMALIDEKRRQGDKYLMVKLTKDLPLAMKTEPDKLFRLLGLLAQDDISEVRENAAKNIAILLDKQPGNTLLWFNALQHAGVDSEVYTTISMEVQNKLIQSLANTQYSLLTAKNEEKYTASLQDAAILLNSAEGQGYQFGKEMNLIYSTLNKFYKYRTLSKISTSKQSISMITNLSTLSTELLHPQAMDVFYKMNQLADVVDKYEKVANVEDKLSYLSVGLNVLEEASKLSRDTLISPERELFFIVLNSWRNIIAFSIRELRGRADLNLSLVSKEVVAKEEKISLMLEIENVGRSMAERTLVELVPSNDYTILSKPQEIGNIGQLRKKEVTLDLQPRTKESFRIEFMVHYDDSERKGKTISFGDLVSFIEVGAEFQEIPNPYIVGTPIKKGSKMFVGRKDLIDFIKKNIQGALQENIIVLIGHRRTGKTTLLKQLPLYLDKRYVPVYIDIQGIIDPGMDAFFYLLATEIVTSMQEQGFEISTPPFEKFKERPSYFFEYEFLKEIYNTLQDKILVVMFDEFEELETKVDSGLLDKNIFSYLRHLMQHTRQLAFIFTGSARLEDLKTDYWSIMFNIALYKRISFLSEEETRKLVIEPVKNYNMIYDSLAVEKIYRLTHGHPYFTQLLSHSLVNLHNREKKNYITIQDVNGELKKIIERGQMHFDFIWDQLSLIERLVMATTMKVYREEGTVTISNLVNKLREYGLNVESKGVLQTLDILCGKDIIMKIMNHNVTYEFQVDLIRFWLENTKNLDQVVEEYRTNT